jgi:hypothetical protein
MGYLNQGGLNGTNDANVSLPTPTIPLPQAFTISSSPSASIGEDDANYQSAEQSVREKVMGCVLVGLFMSGWL